MTYFKVTQFQGKEIRVDGGGRRLCERAGEGTVMPSTRSLRGLHQVACPACTRPLKDAVTTACGHTVCLLCLPHTPMGARLLCPLCQGKEEEQSQAPAAPVPLGHLSETRCEEHGEKIYFFCKTDAELLCVFCREGPAHQTHTVGFLDEAIQPYRDRLRSRLEALKRERDKMEDRKCQEDQKLQEVLMQVESKKQQVEAAFARLKQELRDQRCQLLNRLEELEQQIWKEREEYIMKVSQEVNRLDAQVEELEEKCQRPASELLQDARLHQNRYETKTFVSPEAISSELVKEIRNLHRKILCLPTMLRTFSENLMHHLETVSPLESKFLTNFERLWWSLGSVAEPPAPWNPAVSSIQK